MEITIGQKELTQNHVKRSEHMNVNLKVSKHHDICEDLNKIYKSKNTAYGDSFANLRAEVSNAVLVRIFDKYSRLKNLMQLPPDKLKAQACDESIEDTLKDLANYCIMELVERALSKPVLRTEER